MLKFVVAVLFVLQGSWAAPEYGLDPRVTDGADAAPGEYPYQVSIMWGLPPLLKYRHVCGGSIINHNYVLTAGHCVLRIGKLKVVAGKHYIARSDPANEQTVNVAERIVHQGYNGGVAQHDIALLRLSKSLVYNSRVSPVSLPVPGEQTSGPAVLTGWGSVSKRLLPVMPHALQKGGVTLLDNPTCLEALKAKKSLLGRKKPQLFDTQICSGGATVAACSGDSGGPLVQFRNGQPVQVGIVSWGVYPCGSPGAPSVYTRVSSYIGWLHQYTA